MFLFLEWDLIWQLMYVSEELLQNYVHCLITLCILLLLEHIYFIVLLKHEWQLDAKTIFYVVGHNVITNYNCIICRVINDSIKSASINEMSWQLYNHKCWINLLQQCLPFLLNKDTEDILNHLKLYFLGTFPPAWNT